MNYTIDDFVMEAAMVESTNETTPSDVQMEQWNAEFNVACAAFDAFNKYSLIAEYAQCDIEEFVQEILVDQPAEKGNDKPRNLSELLPENGSQVNGKGILGALHG